jgi:hypothetical protein
MGLHEQILDVIFFYDLVQMGDQQLGYLRIILKEKWSAGNIANGANTRHGACQYLRSCHNTMILLSDDAGSSPAE